MARKRFENASVGDRVKRNFDFLYQLCFTRSPVQRVEMVKNATTDQLLAIVDVCYNIFRKAMHLKPRQEKGLEKYMDHMKKLGRVRSERSAVNVIQTGEGIRSPYRIPRRPPRISKRRGRGFLPAVLAPILLEVAEEVQSKTAPRRRRARNLAQPVSDILL